MAAPLLSLALAACAAQPPAGGGIVSTNPCADAMLVALAPDKLASISHYSQEPGASSIPLDVARRYPANAGTAEEVIALRPSLVLASSFTAPATREAFARAGLNVLYLDSPTSVAASEVQIRQVAAAVGSPVAGEALVARIEAALPHMVHRAWPATLLYIGGSLVSGPNNLLSELMERNGFRNAASDYGLAFTGTLSLEKAAFHPPQVILAPDLHGRQAEARARVLRAVRQFEFPRRLINCGGPAIIAATARLAEVRRSVP